MVPHVSDLTDKDLSELMGWHHRAMFSGDQTGTFAARIRAVADAAAKKEREACAKVCDERAEAWARVSGGSSQRESHAINQCGEIIRARGQA